MTRSGIDGVPRFEDTAGPVSRPALCGGADEGKGSSAKNLLPWRCAGQPPVEGQQAPRRRRVGQHTRYAPTKRNQQVYETKRRWTPPSRRPREQQQVERDVQGKRDHHGEQLWHGVTTASQVLVDQEQPTERDDTRRNANSRPADGRNSSPYRFG